MTYSELKSQLDAFTPEQLAADVVWCGDERGGKVLCVWIAEEDWIDNDGDCEARGQVVDPEPGAAVLIPRGTPHLVVDP